MLAAVFSDSHGSGAAMFRAVEAHRPDQVIFLGDGLRDAEALQKAFPDIPMLLLRGNCDWDAPKTEESALFTLCGVKIFAAHGHRHGVKMDLAGFANSVCCAGAALGLYGHTHRALISTLGGVTLMNPGSAGDRAAPSYGLVRLENGAFTCSLHTLREGPP